MPVVERSDTFLNLARVARSWQLVALSLAATNLVGLLAFARLALLSRLVPYVVEVTEDGSPRALEPLAAAALPEERLLEYQLRLFLWNLRTVVTDEDAQGELLARAYALADAPVRRKLDAHFAEPGNDPRTIAGRAGRTLEVLSLLKMPGTESTYKLRWKEIEVERHALSSPRQRYYEGLLTVAPARIESAEALAANPLGILITDFNWTETNPNL